MPERLPARSGPSARGASAAPGASSPTLRTPLFVSTLIAAAIVVLSGSPSCSRSIVWAVRLVPRLAVLSVMLTGACVSSLEALETDPVECVDLQECLELVPSVAESGSGMSSVESDLAERLREFGLDAIQPLLEMLTSPREEIRDLAAYTLRDAEGLGPEHVDPILKAALADNQGGWLPSALCQIESPQATAGLVTLLRKYPDTTANQIGWAFKKLGPRAVPALLPLFEESPSGSTALLRTAGDLIAELGEEGKSAAAPLASIAEGTAIPLPQRLAALEALGKMGGWAEEAQPALLRLAKSETGAVGDAVRFALYRMGGPGSASVYAEVLRPPDEKFTGLIRETFFDDYFRPLADISALGERGRPATPAIVRLLSNTHPNVRVNAARALGFVRDPAASDDLRSLLAEADWLLVRAAAESLSRIGDEASLDMLEALAVWYWYPPVRAVAADAAKAIRGAHSYPDPDPNNDFAFEFDPKSAPGRRQESCATWETNPPGKRAISIFYSRESVDQAKAHAYEYELDRCTRGPLSRRSRRGRKCPTSGSICETAGFWGRVAESSVAS